MKKAGYLLWLPLTAFTLPDWPTFPVDSYVRVQLPVRPTELNLVELGLADKLPAGAHVFVARAAPDVYQVIGPMAVPAEMDLADPKARSLFYDGVVDGLVTNQGNTLLRRASFPTPAGEGVAVTYHAPPTAAGPPALVTYSRCFITHRNAYVLTYFTTSGTPADSLARRRFFSSLALTP